MNRLLYGSIVLLLGIQIHAQNNPDTLFIQHDTTIQWSAESEKLINLAPKIRAFSLKKWYMDRLKNGTVKAYTFHDESSPVSYRQHDPSIGTQEWLKGLGIELPRTKTSKEWFFVDKTRPADDPDRLRFRVTPLRFSTDSCCGCDDADAFRAKQILSYRNGQFSIYNVYISPLCARRSGNGPLEWFPILNVAYNDRADRKFPGLSNDVVLLNTDEVDYEYSMRNPSSNDSVLTVYRTDIGSLIYQDMLKGNIKPLDVETGKVIPIKKLLTLGMPQDTTAVYNDDFELAGYQVMQQERSPSEFTRFRITQDLYFDFRNERLYSIIRSVVIMVPVSLFDGTLIGYQQFCRIR